MRRSAVYQSWFDWFLFDSECPLFGGIEQFFVSLISFSAPAIRIVSSNFFFHEIHHFPESVKFSVQINHFYSNMRKILWNVDLICVRLLALIWWSLRSDCWNMKIVRIRDTLHWEQLNSSWRIMHRFKSNPQCRFEFYVHLNPQMSMNDNRHSNRTCAGEFTASINLNQTMRECTLYQFTQLHVFACNKFTTNLRSHVHNGVSVHSAALGNVFTHRNALTAHRIGITMSLKDELFS